MTLTFFNSLMSHCWNIRQAWTIFWIISPSLPLQLMRTPHLPNAQVNAQRHCWNWKKIINGLSKSKMNTVSASGDNPITKTTLFAPSSNLYQTDTQGTMTLQPKITWTFNLRNRHNSANNSRVSSSDRSLQSLYHINTTHARHWPIETIPVVLSQMKTDSDLIDIIHWIFEIRLTILHMTVSEKTAEMQFCQISLACVTRDKL